MLPGTTAPQQPQGDGNPQHPPGLALGGSAALQGVVGQGYGIGMFLFPRAWRGWSQSQEWGSAQPSLCSSLDEQMDAAELPGLCPTC